jgi:F-type H+-transporting ATPase subunit 8
MKDSFVLNIIMPQLIPFYFVNQLLFSFITLAILVYVLSKYILPLFTYKNVVRLYLTKLTNKS